MKLLPKKSIDIAKANERKIEIDAGVSLARKIDALRETKEQEQRQLQLWRENSIKEIKKEIADSITTLDNLKKNIEKAEVYRKKLLEPLDKEWEEVNNAKESIKNDREEIQKTQESLKQNTEQLEKVAGEISKIADSLKNKHQEIDILHKKASDFEELTRKEYQRTKDERIKLSERYSKQFEELTQSKKEYDIGIETNLLAEKINKEKESELIIREQTLQRRINNFERVTK